MKPPEPALAHKDYIPTGMFLHLLASCQYMRGTDQAVNGPQYMADLFYILTAVDWQT